MSSGKLNIWILVNHREGYIEREIFGLAAEARRLIAESGFAKKDSGGKVMAVALGTVPDSELKKLGPCGVDGIIYAGDNLLSRYNGELFAEVLHKLSEKYKPSCIMMDYNPDTSDLAPRLAALMGTALVTRAVDLAIGNNGKMDVIRPVSNGYLFEKLTFENISCPVITFQPSALNDPEMDETRDAAIIKESIDINSFNLKTKVTEVMEAGPEGLGIEEADIVISGGRGAGSDESFDIIRRLAELLNGSVGGTRPVIDSQILPFERQIGQTGKTISPRLLFACGISGANEFTAGMEKSRIVIAVNTDSGARIFRFADLAVIGDVHEVLPALIKKIEEWGS